jgi:hypothetical protein
MPFSWVQTSDVTANDRCGIIVAMAERYADDMPRLVGEAEFASSYGGSAHSVANVVAAGRLFFVTQGKQKLCPDFFLNPAHDGRQPGRWVPHSLSRHRVPDGSLPSRGRLKAPPRGRFRVACGSIAVPTDWRDGEFVVALEPP